jgi:hypothetical protein
VSKRGVNPSFFSSPSPFKERGIKGEVNKQFNIQGSCPKKVGVIYFIAVIVKQGGR